MSRLALVRFAFCFAACFLWVLGGCAHPAALPSASAAAAKAPIAPALKKSPDPHFDALSDDVLVEHGASAALGARVLRDYEGARRDLTRVFGSVISERPVAVVCESSTCVQYVAGPPGRSWALGPHQSLPGAEFISGDRSTIAIVRADEGTGAHMLHEMIHLEAHERLGEARVPAWFHKGLAFSYANRDECKKPYPNGIDDLRRLDDNRAWAEFTNRHLERLHITYCQAFREVDTWLSGRDRDAPRTLLDAVRNGKSFYDVYGSMLTQTSAVRAPEDASFDHGATLGSTTPDVVTLSGKSDSLVRQEGFTDLARGDKPLSIAMWIRPSANAGELVHVSENPDGTGWCLPFVGYDASGRIIAQILHGRGEAESEFAVTSAPTPPTIGKWTHVAFTWSPGGEQRLYIDGVRVAATKSQAYRASGGVLYVTWGSPGEKGLGACWAGAITSGAFRGALGHMQVLTKELAPNEIADLARVAPAR